MQQFSKRSRSSISLRMPILSPKSLGLLLFGTLILSSFISKAQDSNLKPVAFSETKVQFEKEMSGDQKGLGTYTFLSRNNNTIEAQYNFEKSSTPNPFKISYSYDITKSEDGALLLDLSSIVDPLEMMIDESIEIRSSKDKVEYPSNIKTGALLKEVDGHLDLYTKKGKLFLTYKVSISNRKVERKETISIGSKSVEAFVISYDYSFEKSNKFDVVLQKSDQQVIEWFLPGVGIIKQNRSGEKVIQSMNDEGGTGSSVDFINTNSSIKRIDQY